MCAINQCKANQWKKELRKMLADKEPKDIFNIDETGLSSKCNPVNS